MEEVIQAAESAQIREFIESLPEKVLYVSVIKMFALMTFFYFY